MSVSSRAYGLFEGVLIAFDAIRANKVRAALTILGIAVGVFVVTAMSAAVHGINAGVEKSIAAAGPTTFFLTRWPMQLNTCNGSADSCPWRRNRPLTMEHAKRIAELPSIRGVTAHVSTSAAIKYADRELPGVQLDGFTPGWIAVSGGDIAPGRDFTAAEDDAAARVVLINDKLAERLFVGSEAVGKDVRLNGQTFRVIGVFHPIVTAFDAGDKGRAIVPFQTARRRLNVGVNWMDLTVKPREGIPQATAMDEVVTLLRGVRHLRPGTENDFFLTTQEKVMELYDRIVGVFFLVMLVLSAVGLIVGGVGVVAIMMISVTERTREIGVRKALGATRGTILWQFLVEAATLTSVGAVIGLAVGGALVIAIRNLTPIEAAIPPLAIVAALATSAFTGVLFGLLPAARAARLDPVEALRYE